MTHKSREQLRLEGDPGGDLAHPLPQSKKKTKHQCNFVPGKHLTKQKLPALREKVADNCHSLLVFQIVSFPLYEP